VTEESCIGHTVVLQVVVAPKGHSIKDTALRSLSSSQSVTEESCIGHTVVLQVVVAPKGHSTKVTK